MLACQFFMALQFHLIQDLLLIQQLQVSTLIVMVFVMRWTGTMLKRMVLIL